MKYKKCINSMKYPFYSLSQRNHLRHPTPLQVITTTPKHGRAVRKNTMHSKNGRVKLIQLHMYQGSTVSDLSRIDAQPPPSFLCCPRPPSRHPSSPTSVSLVPALHLLPPSTPFWPYDTHPFFSYE